MKLFNKVRVITGLAIVTAVASFAGAVSGTVAWFAYSTRVAVSFQGTSIDQSVLIEAGLACDQKYWSTDEDLQDIKDNYGLEYYGQYSGKHIYFAKGTNLGSGAIGAYLQKTGYAINELQPTTSAKYVTDIEGDHVGNDLTLYKSPMYGKEFRNAENGNANNSQFSRLQLAFRVLKTNGTEINPNQKVYLTHATAEASGVNDGEVYKAIRVFFDGSASRGKKFILNPSAENDGSTNVAGLLNLNNNDYYDTFNGKEIIYGDYNDSLSRSVAADDSDFIDMNKTGDFASRTTFYGKHKKDMEVYDYDADSFIDGIDPDKADYLSLNTIKPNSNFTTGLPVTITSNDAYGIGLLDVKIWLEGWDHSVIDTEINHKFNLGLQFEVNRE